MTDLPPPPPPEPWPARDRRSPRPGPDNPRRYPSRRPQVVAGEVARAEAQRVELEHEMARTGQSEALVVAAMTACPSPRGGVHTEATCIQGRTTVLPKVDVLVLVTVPMGVDDEAPRSIVVRWDVVARVCGAGCWQPVPGLDPPRWITRRWPTHDEWSVLEGLSLPPGTQGT